MLLGGRSGSRGIERSLLLLVVVLVERLLVVIRRLLLLLLLVGSLLLLVVLGPVSCLRLVLRLRLPLLRGWRCWIARRSLTPDSASVACRRVGVPMAVAPGSTRRHRIRATRHGPRAVGVSTGAVARAGVTSVLSARRSECAGHFAAAAVVLVRSAGMRMRARAHRGRGRGAQRPSGRQP